MGKKKKAKKKAKARASKPILSTLSLARETTQGMVPKLWESQIKDALTPYRPWLYHLRVESTDEKEPEPEPLGWHWIEIPKESDDGRDD